MICSRIDEVAAADPDGLAVIDDGVSLTYRELVRRSVLLAGELRERLQVGEGEVIAISLPNSWQYPAAFLAAARIGAVLMPFNPQWRGKEIAWFVRRLGIRTVITNRELSGVWSEAEGAPSSDRILNVDGERLQRLWDQPGASSALDSRRMYEKEPALYLATSGSTGRPKLVPRTHANLLAGRRAVSEALGIRGGDRFLSVIPFHHANGFSNCMFLPLASGATMIMLRKALPAALTACVKRERAQIVIGSPSLFSLIADHAPRPEDLSSVKLYISSGAPLPEMLAASWRDRFGREIRQLYGSSEAGVISIEDADGATTPGSVGRLLPTVSMRITDQAGAEVPAGMSGQISVRSPAMMEGYVDEPELNRAAFEAGFFRTGDIGRLMPDRQLVLEGRSKRWINSGGVKVDPVEVEKVLMELPSVRQCRVQSGRDTRGFEVPAATIAVHPGQACTRREIVEHCRKHLAEYKIPRVIQFVDALPSELTGKTPMEWLQQ